MTAAASARLEDCIGADSMVAASPQLEVRGAEYSSAEVEGVAKDLKLPLRVARMMLARGVVDPLEQHRLLHPRLQDLHRPDQMAGFTGALELLQTAHRSRWRVGVFGDYDVDGVTTATILTTFLEAIGMTVVARVAQRSGGYGLGRPDAKALAESGVRLVLTGDCGTSDLDALQWLRDQGLRTVVIDHHQVPEQMPPCDALINPHQPGCAFPFKGMCSAGVAFYLCAALRTRLAQSGEATTPLPDPREWLDLVALATVCDMMPLRGENRIFVTQGLRRMNRSLRPGLAALLGATPRDPDEVIDEGHLGFRLGPRINAPGRLGPAEPALRLMRARTEAEAMPLAEQIETLNARRKRHQEQTVVEALALLAAEPGVEERAALVVAHEGWLPGVVGIAAAGVAEHYRRPTLVLAIDREQGVARGSVRSFGRADVRAALAECADFLVRFGGHREAAGATVKLEHLPAVIEGFDAAIARQGHIRDANPVESVDAVIPLVDISPELVEQLRILGPYGVGFEKPRFACDDAEVASVRVLKKKHIALVLQQDGARRDAIAFGQAHHNLTRGERIGCLFVPEIDVFRGRRQLKMHVERLWRV